MKKAEDPMCYLDHNNKLAECVFCLLDLVKKRLLKQLKVDYSDLDLEKANAAIDERVRVNKSKNLPKDHPKKLDKIYDFLSTVLNNTSETHAKNVQKKTAEVFDVDLKTIPTIDAYKATRPKIEKFTLKACDADFSAINKSEKDATKEKLSNKELKRHTKMKNRCANGISGAKIKGGYKEAFNLMLQTHKKYNRKVCGKVIVLNSADGKRYIDHLSFSESNVISFNTQIWAKLLKEYFTMSNSLDIVTFLQITADEQLEYVEEEFTKICDHIKKLEERFEKGKKRKEEQNENEMEDDAAVEYFFYKMGEMKFFYMVAKNCQWNVTHHPFLCCTCKSGKGVKNNRKHTCEFLSHNDEIRLYDLLEKQWIEGKENYVLDMKNYDNY